MLKCDDFMQFDCDSNDVIKKKRRKELTLRTNKNALIKNEIFHYVATRRKKTRTQTKKMNLEKGQ